MTTKAINVGVESAERGYDRFVEAWKKAESGIDGAAEVHLKFEDFAMLAAVLTPKRLELLKMLRQKGPMNVKSLSRAVGRDYKNVHVDSSDLEKAGLIQRDDQGHLTAPWDVIDARFQLVA